MRTVVSGVRSSCDTSDVNWRCRSPYSSSWRICSDSDSAILLKLTAKRAISSSPSTAIRSRRCPAANRSAIRDADRTGAVTWLAKNHVMPTSSSVITTVAPANRPRTRASVDSSPVIGKTRYSSSPGTSDAVGVPITSAEYVDPSRASNVSYCELTIPCWTNGRSCPGICPSDGDITGSPLGPGATSTAS